MHLTPHNLSRVFSEDWLEALQFFQRRVANRNLQLAGRGSITAAELEKILSARTQSWPDGKPITVVLHDPSSADMQLVLRKLLNMTPDQAHALIHAHSGAIVVADSDDAVLRYVSGTRGAVGIIDLYSLTKDVKVLKVDGKLPVEQGYILRGN